MSCGCFGCCGKPAPIIAVDEPSKGLRIQCRAVKKPSISDDFWSTSTRDLENGVVPCQRSVSSISVSNANINSGANGISNSEFVNHGFLLWQQSRRQWIGNKTSRDQTLCRWERRLSWSATCEGLLRTRNPYSRAVPLPEMVNFLVDVWGKEGLYG